LDFEIGIFLGAGAWGAFAALTVDEVDFLGDSCFGADLLLLTRLVFASGCGLAF